MSWFKNKHNATAALPLPPPAQTIHNHPQSWAGTVAVAFACAVLGIVLAFLALRFLAAEAGSQQPGRDVAQGIIAVICGVLLTYGGGWGIGKLYVMFQEQKRKTLAMVHNFELEQARILRLAATTGAVGARALEADYATARGCLAVLEVAYRKLDGRKYRANEARHWVRDTAWKTINDAHVQGVKWSDCSGFRDWLEDKGFIIGDQLNYAKFPEFEDARRAIDQIAAPPILINKPAPYYQETASIIK